MKDIILHLGLYLEVELHGITTGEILYEDKKIELISDTDMRRYNGKDQAFAIYAAK